MKDLLQSLVALSEGETKDTKTGRVHKGTYGSEYETDKEGNETKKAAPEVKKGRGRPKKDADSSGEVKKYDSSSLGNVFGGGKKPAKPVGTVSKKHSLKEYIESTEQMKRFETVMEGMFGGVDHSSIASNLSKLARVIKSVQTPEQFAVAQKYSQRMSGSIMNYQHDKMGFGSGMKANMGLMGDVQADLMAKAKELGIPYNALEETDQIEIKPASATNTQVIQQGNKTLGTVNNPQLANQIKQSIGKGEMTLAGDEQQMNESKKEKEPEGLYSKKRFETDSQRIARLAKEKKQAEKKKTEEKVDEAAKPDFKDVDKDGDKKESWKKAEKDKAKKKVDESISLSESPETLQHIIGKYRNEVKRFMNGDELDHDLYEALFDYYFNAGEMPYGTAKGRTGDPYEWITQRFDQDVHDHVVDENTIRDFTQHALAEPTNNFRTQGQQPGSMAAPRGAKTEINRPVPEPTPWGTDPIAAATDRAFNFVSSLGKGTKFTKESTDMKDIQLEGWEKQLNGLLSEGITVSSSQGQQGAPDTVSVTASDADADALLSVLRNAGIGGFGAEPQAPEIGYGVTQGGEEEPNGTGTEPQASPDVVGDDGDMLSMLKKMAGLEGGDAEVVAIDATGDEQGQDYEDEAGGEAQDQTLEPTDGEEEQGSEEESGEEEETGSEEESGEEEEVTDEGNAFTGQLKKTPQGGNFKMGDKSYKDTSAIEEGTCESCGQAACGCNEQVEENFANSVNDPADTELAQLKALLSMGNDLHRMKQSQAMGNPVKVTMETKLMKESTSILSDYKKLSGL